MVDKLEAGERWQHVKRGTSYEVLGTALLQDAAGNGIQEGHPLVIYRGEDGMLWARGSNEFADGRFVKVERGPGLLDDGMCQEHGRWLCAHCLRGHTLVEEDEHATQDTRDRVKVLEEARQIVRDIYWMARRYADGRQSYAVGMFNDAVRKAYDAGWLVHKLDHEPPFARDSMFSPEWKSIEQRAHEAEQEAARLRRAIERHYSGEDGDRELYTALGNKETDRHG